MTPVEDKATSYRNNRRRVVLRFQIGVVTGIAALFVFSLLFPAAVLSILKFSAIVFAVALLVALSYYLHKSRGKSRSGKASDLSVLASLSARLLPWLLGAFVFLSGAVMNIQGVSLRKSRTNIVGTMSTTTYTWRHGWPFTWATNASRSGPPDGSTRIQISALSSCSKYWPILIVNVFVIAFLATAMFCGSMQIARLTASSPVIAGILAILVFGLTTFLMYLFRANGILLKMPLATGLAFLLLTPAIGCSLAGARVFRQL